MNAPSKVTAVPPQVYAKIAAVQGDLAKQGIGKDSENTFDRYKFRGIDAVYNALAPLLAKHGLCVLPRIIERDCQERVSKKGDPMFYVTVTAEFDFVAESDGSIHTVRTYGEAMDRSDKATNKAMSAAYKYAAFMAFAGGFAAARWHKFRNNAATRAATYDATVAANFGEAEQEEREAAEAFFAALEQETGIDRIMFAKLGGLA